MRNSLRAMLFLIGGMALSTGIGLASLSAQPLEQVPDHLYLGKNELSGLQPANLSQEVERMTASDTPLKLELTVGGEMFLFPSEEVGLRIDADATAQRIQQELPKNKAEQLWNAWIEEAPLTVQPALMVDAARLDQSLSSLAEVLNRLPVNASIFVVDGQIVITPDERGRTLNVSDLSDWIVSQLQQTDKIQLEAKDSIAFRTVYANQTASDLQQYRFILTQAETRLSESPDEARKQFVKTLHSLPLVPDVDFDFALLYLDTSIPEVMDRLSSMIYQAVLPVIGIDITERHAAAHMPEFTQPGLEAVVSDGGRLAFVNRTGTAMLFTASLFEDILTISLLSSDAVALRQINSVLLNILISDEVVSKTHELAPGEVNVLTEGRHGAVVSVRDAGGTELYQDIYPAENRVIEIGIQRAAVPK